MIGRLVREMVLLYTLEFELLETLIPAPEPSMMFDAMIVPSETSSKIAVVVLMKKLLTIFALIQPSSHQTPAVPLRT